MRFWQKNPTSYEQSLAFLSDPSPIIGYACHSLAHLLTDSLTDSCLVDLMCCLVNLLDVTLTCEDAHSKLVEVVIVADIDAEDHVGNSLVLNMIKICV